MEGVAIGYLYFHPSTAFMVTHSSQTGKALMRTKGSIKSVESHKASRDPHNGKHAILTPLSVDSLVKMYCSLLKIEFYALSYLGLLA